MSALMAIADDHLQGLAPEADDTAAERELRRAAMAARGRLEHGIRAGVTGVRDELRRVRQGAQALRGYKDATLGIGDRVERDA